MVHGFATELATIRRCMRGWSADDTSNHLEPVCNDCRIFHSCELVSALRRRAPATHEPETRENMQ